MKGVHIKDPREKEPSSDYLWWVEKRAERVLCSRKEMPAPAPQHMLILYIYQDPWDIGSTSEPEFDGFIIYV